MSEKNDPPIIEREFIAGVRVVDIGDYRVARGMTRRAFSSCPHKRMVYDQNERRVWCKDCEKDVESFDAFKLIAENFTKQNAILAKRERKITEAENHNIRRLAVKTLDKAWSKKRAVPCCPHCNEGLLPDDFKNGVGLSSKSYALEQRRRKSKEKEK